MMPCLSGSRVAAYTPDVCRKRVVSGNGNSTEKTKQVDTYGDDAEAAVLRGQVDREVLVRAAETRDRLAALESRSLERDLAADDAHEVADDDDLAVAQLRGEVLPAVRGVYCMQ